jgi:hypothetical protein
MSDTPRAGYVAAFGLGLGDGVTLERYRAPRGGLHKMRLVHHESGVCVERDYDGGMPVLEVQNELIGRFQAKLSENGLSWFPARDRNTDTT